MNYEHLIEINQPENILMPQLTRDQLWHGLMLRAEDACPFVPGMVACTILERSEDHYLRRLDFPQASIIDRVTWDAGQWICFSVAASDTHAGGTLTIRIESPAPAQQPEHLFLRFIYRTSLGESADDADAAYSEYVKSAYHAADIDTVRVIRTLLAEGPPH